MRDLGDFPVGGVVDFTWETNAAAGGSITRGTNGTVRLYKNNSATQRASSAGITDTEDFDSLTGVHQLRIDLADNTDAGFYAAGNEYDVVLEGAVIDGVTKNAVLAHFSIERAGGILALLKHATYGLAALETLVDDLETNVLTALGVLARSEDASGTLAAIAAGATTLAAGHGLAANAVVLVKLTGGTNAKGRMRLHTYSGSGDVWTPSPAWDANSEPVPSGTITYAVWAVAPVATSDLAAIADAVCDEALSGHTTAGTVGERIGRIPNAAAGANGGLPTVDASNRVAGIAGTITTLDALDTAQDTQHATTQGRLPAALVGGRMDVSVGAMAANVMTAAAAASDLTTELQSGLATATSLATVASYIDTEIATIIANIAALNNLSAAQVRSELAVELARIDATVSSRLASASYTAPPSAAVNASAVRTELATELARLDATISSRATVAAIFADVVEGTTTFAQGLRLTFAVLLGKSSGHAAGAPIYRDLADTKDRVTATVDADGNRTAVTRDAA